MYSPTNHVRGSEPSNMIHLLIYRVQDGMKLPNSSTHTAFITIEHWVFIFFSKCIKLNYYFEPSQYDNTSAFSI